MGVIRILVENEAFANALILLKKAKFIKAYFDAYTPTMSYANWRDEGTGRFFEDLIDTLRLFVDCEYDPELYREKVAKLVEGDLVVKYLYEQPLEYYEKMGFIEDDLLSFLHDRLKVYLKDQGVRHDIIDACISSSDGAPAGATDGNDDLTLLVKRAKALSETLKTDDGENLIQGFKRANNILSQAEDADGVEYSFGADIKFAETEEERALFAALDTAEAQIKPAMEAQDFGTAMSAMASLRGPIDAFFDAVQVNADNATVRRNRLNLLSRIRTICSSVADLTKIDG